VAQSISDLTLELSSILMAFGRNFVSTLATNHYNSSFSQNLRNFAIHQALVPPFLRLIDFICTSQSNTTVSLIQQRHVQSSRGHPTLFTLTSLSFPLFITAVLGTTISSCFRIKYHKWCHYNSPFSTCQTNPFDFPDPFTWFTVRFCGIENLAMCLL